MFKTRFISLLVLLAAVVTGAWAQTNYKVSVKEGTEDATNWTITPAEATTTGVAAGTEVKATYSGTKHVKSVKAVKKVPAATVTTAPTAKKGVKAGQNEAIVNAGTAEGGTMMYMVNATQPASTDGFSATVPTAEGLTAGTYYVWYYVKADDSHTDSEISASGIEVTIAAAKSAATVTTAPTGAPVVGVGKTTALVSGGEADGGTLMYAVTTTYTQPTSTAGFSASVPTAQTITASGKVYVWYYVKADDTHTDSEIAAIEVPVADIVWDATNVSDIRVMGTYWSYEKEGVTLSGNAEQVQVQWYDLGHPEWDGMGFEVHESGGFTFTAPSGKAFTKIEMKALGENGWFEAYLGTGWALLWDNPTTITWTGSAASTVGLLTDVDNFNGAYISYIAFYLSE